MSFIHTKKIKKALLVTVFSCIFCSLTTAATGGQYTPEGLYDPEFFTLGNGMNIVLKKRDVTHNVAIILAVNVGMLDFPCGKKELPHFLEHLLFTGTSKHSEAELDELIEGHGGSWNGATREEMTVYTIDIYSPNTLFAIDMLYEILTDSQLTEENVELTRDIIHREGDGKPSKIRQWLYRHGVGRDAFTNAYLALLQGSDVSCPTLQTAEGITRNDIISVYKKYYVPNGMFLVVVGEFDRDALIKKIQATFGSLKPKQVKRNQETMPAYYKKGPAEFKGLFSPIVDSDAYVGLAFRTNGYLSPDSHALTVIERYLYKRIYDTLRIAKGLSYSPSTSQFNLGNYGIFNVYTDVDTADMDTALDELKREVKKLRDGTFNPDDIAQAKQKILLSWVQGFESNAGIAGYYISQHHEFLSPGSLINHEEKIESVTVTDVRDVASRYFAEENSVIIKSSPQFSYTQFYILTGLALLMTAFFVWRIIRRIRGRGI